MSLITEEILINAISHTIRRTILQILSSTPQTFTGLMNYFDISSAKLTYHLKNIQGFVTKDDDNFYHLSSLGTKAVRILINIQTEITDEDQPLIKDTYLGQKSSGNSLFLRGIDILLFLLGFAFFLSLTISIIAINESDTPVLVYVVIVLIMVSELIAFLWLYLLRKRAPKTISKFLDQWQQLTDSTK